MKNFTLRKETKNYPEGLAAASTKGEINFRKFQKRTKVNNKGIYTVMYNYIIT